jgi:hypothetical protein
MDLPNAKKLSQRNLEYAEGIDLPDGKVNCECCRRNQPSAVPGMGNRSLSIEERQEGHVANTLNAFCNSSAFFPPLKCVMQKGRKHSGPWHHLYTFSTGKKQREMTVRLLLRSGMSAIHSLPHET